MFLLFKESAGPAHPLANGASDTSTAETPESLLAAAPLEDENGKQSGRTEQVLPPQSDPSILPPFQGVDGILIRVFNSDGAVVPECDVYFVDGSLASEAEVAKAKESWASGPTQLLRKFGHHYQTDANGEVRIPRPSDHPMVLAEKERSFAYLASIPKDAKTVKLTLRANRTLLIRTVDLFDNPVADVPVAFYSDMSFSIHIWFTLMSDSDGLIHLEDLDSVLGSGSANGTNFAALAIPLNPDGDQARVALNEEVVENGEITLILPATGKVRIRILDSFGTPYQGKGKVQILKYTDSQGFNRRPLYAREISDGMVEFPFIGLNATVVAAFVRPGIDNLDEATFKGPTTAGATAEAILTLQERIQFTGTLLAPDGKPLTDQLISVVHQVTTESGDRSSIGPSQTDEDGSFQLEFVVKRGSGELQHGSVSFSTILEPIGKIQAKHVFEFPLPAELHNIGKLKLIQPPILLQGSVLDLEGNPIKDANVRIQMAQDHESGERQWRPYQKGLQSTDAEGWFQIRNEWIQAPAYRVSISAASYEQIVEEIQLGETTHEWRMGMRTLLHGSILLDPNINIGLLRVFLIEGEERLWAILSQGSEPGLANFWFAPKSTTAYTFEIRTPSEEVVASVGPLTMKAGVANRPPALQPLDLRGKVFGVHLDVQDSKGKPVAAKVSLKSAKFWSGYEILDKGLDLVTPSGYEEILIRADRYQDKTLYSVNSDQVITLEPAMEVPLQIPTEVLAIPGIKVQVSAYQISDESRLEYTPYYGETYCSMPDSSGRSTLYPSVTGDHQLNMKIQFAESTEWHRLKSSRLKITVDSTSGLIELPVDMQEIYDLQK
ncbi:MAG: hypothetical protein H8E15_04390 [Planctomycetes bacterium]|nr:hypothetical protein [Planctomycetota bacterium]